MPVLTYTRSIKILIALAVGFFWVYAFLYTLGGGIYNSPDETMNAFFINLLSKDNTLRYEEGLNELAKNNIHPRSTLVMGEAIVPVSFLGIIVIHAVLAKIFGMNLVILFVALLSAITPLFFYSIVRRLFDERIAFFSALLLWFHPAFIYYSARGFLPNALFIDLVIISIYFVLVFWHQHSNSQAYIAIMAAGFTSALAVMTRMSEIIWLVIIALFVAIAVRNQLKFRFIVIFIAVFCLTLIPFLKLQNDTYGHPLSNGYIQLNPSDLNNELGHGDASWTDRLNELALIGQANKQIQKIDNDQVVKSGWLIFVFPFGIDLVNTAKSIYFYFIQLFWWLFVPGLVGLIIVLTGRNYKADRYMRGYAIVTILVFIYLGIYYGSWHFFDNINQNVTIGNSYVRYWLPVYILFLPFVVIGLTVLLDKIQRKITRLFLTGVIIFAFIALSWIHAFYNGEESLWRIVLTLESYKYQQEVITNLTERNAVIITPRMDKVIFPQRKVIMMSAIDIVYNLDIIANLLHNKVPVYIYSQMSKEDLDFLNGRFLEETKFRIIPMGGVYDGHALYKLVSR